ncbi:hypothetical protein A1O3_04263 [Capronia epimyces CBS 606.96]|uniref:Uncharacterized protein n=1 Tax=Capronia epimyces CBS 606.96 TaxID=1182542 RepID=W9YYD1_9EURO|nr:uncharacterized protein A1O3_04263 [Capronia epimyces CBS 606.96]EXJ87304.1 hypothetical protein A1O3_04263 [Capronia epimyces CBS 606.96]
MHLLNQLAAPPSLDRVLRPLLLINNVVAMSLSFAAGGALFIVLGVFFAVSIVFNILVVLLTVGQRQLRLNTAGDPQCPSLIILAIETLGVMAFLVLYVCTTINAAAGGRYYYDEPSVMMLSYASIGALVAM